MVLLNYQLILLILSFSGVYSHKFACESLSFRTGVDIICEHPVTKESLDCQSRQVPIGTTAEYKCEDFYVTKDGEVDGGKMKCDEEGQWLPENPFRSFSCQIDCGKSFSSEIENTKWPWHVGIFSKASANKLKFECGGTLINPFNAGLFVLTSAECLAFRDGFNIANLEVRMGLFDGEDDVDGAEIFSVRKVGVGGEGGLLALLQLKQDPILSKNILPVCFSGNIEFANRQLQQADSLNWQLVGFDNSKNIRNVSLGVLSREFCQNESSKPANSICAGNSKGKRICNGDFGSGLLVSSYSSGSMRQYIQGVLTEKVGNCRNHGTFSKVSSTTRWIKKTALMLQREKAILEHFERIQKQKIQDNNKTPKGSSTGGSNTNRIDVPSTTIQPQILKPTVTIVPDTDVSSSSNLRDYEVAALEFHNFYRRKHGVPPVTLSRELSQESQNEANRAIQSDVFKYQGFTNWYKLTGGNLSLKRLVTMAIQDWYKSSTNYDWEVPTALPFTQLVWKDTSEIGVGVSRKDDKQLVVVKYNRPLVVTSQAQSSFQKNVLRPVKRSQ